jgi:two-component system LytT family response regulator
LNTTNENIKILIADDELLARKRIASFLAETNNNFKVNEATNGKEAIEVITSENTDLLFLDIKMTDMTGFEVLQRIPKEKMPIIIFVTAFDNFAVEAFKVQALDFLLKPYKKDRFFEALKRGLYQLEISQKVAFQDKVKGLMNFLEEAKYSLIPKNQSYLDKVVLKVNKKFSFIKVEDILYVKASGYYAEIFTKEKQRYVYRISMTDFIKQLNPMQFSRVNRSTILNRNFIKEVVSEGLGDYSVIMNDRVTFNVSKNFREDFLIKLGIK